MGGCSIRKCKSRSIRGSEIRFFKFPTQESQANKWLRYCGPKTSIKNARICSKHFLPSDYIKPLRHILLNISPRKVRTLKPDAIPSLEIEEIEDIDEEANEKKVVVMDSFEVAESSGVVTFDHPYHIRPCREELPTVPMAKYEQLKREHDTLKHNLHQIFTPGQVACLLKPKTSCRVKWSEEDIIAAISLRTVSAKAYRYLRATVGIPLPGASTLRKWASKSEINESQLKISVKEEPNKDP